MEDCYSVLGVARSAEAGEIRRAYLRQVKALHPDVNPSPEAADAFRRITRAYETLSEPARRQAHDLELARLAGAARPRGDLFQFLRQVQRQAAAGAQGGTWSGELQGMRVTIRFK